MYAKRPVRANKKVTLSRFHQSKILGSVNEAGHCFP